MRPAKAGVVGSRLSPFSRRQEALAHEAGVNRTYMSKLEKGGSFVGLEHMVKLAKVLEVEPADFLKVPPRKPRRPSTVPQR